MNYINNIPLPNDDNDDLINSLLPTITTYIEGINAINFQISDSHSCDSYTDDFYKGYININRLVRELKSNLTLNSFFFDYTNYSIAENWQWRLVSTPVGRTATYEDVANTIPFSFTDIFGRTISTKLKVSLNKRKCELDLDKPGYIFNIKKNNPYFEIRFPYKDAVDKRDFSITPDIQNDFHLSLKYNGITIKATTVYDFLEVCKRIGSYEFALKKISKKYSEAIKKEKDGSELNYLYSNLPPVILVDIKNKKSITHDILINHLYKLVDYDDTGWLSGWRDSSSAILNLLQIIGDSDILYNLFKLNPKLVKRMYYNLDGKILYEGEYIRSRTVFAGILTILSKSNSCENPEKERITFTNGQYHRILSNQVSSDTINESYDLTQQSRKTKTVTENFHGGGGDGSAGNQRITYKKPQDWEDKGTHYLEPLDLVYFIDTSWEDKTPILVPAIYVKSISDEEEWKDIHLSIRIGANILAIVLGVASLGASSPLIVALGVIDIGIATGDIIVATSEDALMETPEGREFLNVWNKVALVGGIATAGPLLVRSAFKVTGKMFAKATNPKTIAFLQDSIQNLLQKVKNLPDFRHNSIEIIFDIIEEFRYLKLPRLPNRLENLRQLGVLFIKGDVKIGGILKKEYVLIYKGEVIFSGTFKNFIKEIDDIIKKGGADIGKYLDETIEAINFARNLINKLKTKPNEAFFWSGRTNGIGGQKIALEVAQSKNGITLEGLITKENIKMPIWDISNPKSIKIWESVSREYARQVIGEVRGVIGSNLRKGNVWENFELPALMKNPNVTKITTIDPVTKIEKVIFTR